MQHPHHLHYLMHTSSYIVCNHCCSSYTASKHGMFLVTMSFGSHKQFTSQNGFWEVTCNAVMVRTHLPVSKKPGPSIHRVETRGRNMVNLYKTAWCHNPEDGDLQSPPQEQLMWLCSGTESTKRLWDMQQSGGREERQIKCFSIPTAISTYNTKCWLYCRTLQNVISNFLLHSIESGKYINGEIIKKGTAPHWYTVVYLSILVAVTRGQWAWQTTNHFVT